MDSWCILLDGSRPIQTYLAPDGTIMPFIAVDSAHGNSQTFHVLTHWRP